MQPPVPYASEEPAALWSKTGDAPGGRITEIDRGGAAFKHAMGLASQRTPPTHTFPTAYGPRLAFAPAPLHLPADPAAALARAALLERLADLHQNEGCGWHADRLSHQALELRCRATGERA